MEGSHVNSETVSHQYPQQQQQQTFEIPPYNPFDGQSSQDDYDEMAVMTRRSPQTETKTNVESNIQKESERKVEPKIMSKNEASPANSLNTTSKKDGRDEP